MSLFARPWRQQASRLEALVGAHHVHARRYVAICVDSDDILAARGLNPPRFQPPFLCPPSFNFGEIQKEIIPTPNNLTPAAAAIGASLIDGLGSLLRDISTWFIKRTYQPSIIRKRRKHGFRRRKTTVGGRRILKRRAAKGRIRLGGC